MPIRNFLFLLILLSFTMAVNAQRVKRKGVTPVQMGNSKKPKAPLYSVEQFKGKWQEISREDHKKKAVEFTDSILLNFMDDNKAETRTSADNKMTMKGSAQIDGDNTLMVAADVYTILSAQTDKIVLDDGDQYVHTLKKVDEFMYEKLGRLTVTQAEFKYPVPFSIQDITGKWMVYRRQAKPGTVNPPTTLIKYLNITTKTGDDTATGEITFYQSEKSEALACTIKQVNTSIEIKAGINNWSLFVYKADGKEFVFGNVDELLYYCKPSSQ